MDNLDRWFNGGGCGPNQLCLSDDWRAESAIARRETLQLLEHRWPFFHFAVGKEGFDPLVIPVVKFLNNIPGIRTVTSCQGHPGRCPYVWFAAEEKGLHELGRIMRDWRRSCHGSFVNTGIVYDTFYEDEGTMYTLQFYDTLALMQFTLDHLKIPLVDQCQVPTDVMFVEDAVFPLADPAWLEPFMHCEYGVVVPALKIDPLPTMEQDEP